MRRQHRYHDRDHLSVVRLSFKSFLTPTAPGQHPIPRDRATAPSPTQTAALVIPGERMGIAAKLGERRFFKVALPETSSNHYILCRLNGRALDSGQAERQLNPPVSAFSFLFLLYCCTIIVHTYMVRSWVVGWIFLLYSAVLLYDCTHIHGE